jgi:hypothetical protein
VATCVTLIYGFSVITTEADIMALEEESLRRRSVGVHFRIWTDVYDSLEDEARKRKVNLNTLVNQMLSTETRDELPLEEMGFLRMSRDVYRVTLGLIPDDKLSEYGRMSAKSEDTVMLARSGAVTLDAVLDELRLLSRLGWNSFQQTKRNGKETISLVHNLGPRYSLVCGSFVTGLFALAGVHTKVTTTNSSVLIEY